MRGLGRSSRTEDLGRIVVASSRGTPVFLSDIAEVKIGAAPKNGAVLRQGETLSGMVIMLKGENGKQVIEAIKQKIASLHLPEGVKLQPLYDQSDVIDGTLGTVTRNLLEGFILVTVILLLFLGNVRAPARLRSYKNESSVGEDQRNHVRLLLGIKRSTFNPHCSRPRAKLSVREGIAISADHPSAVFAVRGSQIPSQSREALCGLSIKPSTRAPAALIWKK